MIQFLKNLRFVAVLLGTVSLLSIASSPVFAANGVLDSACQANPSSAICQQSKNAGTRTTSFVKQIINTLLYVVGIIAVIMIVIGGLRYTLSGGDSSAVSSAKNTVLYSVVGLIVAMLSFVIVNFVLERF